MNPITPGTSIFLLAAFIVPLCAGMRKKDTTDRGTVIMGTTHSTHRHVANCTIMPPSTKPRQRPKVPAAAKLNIGQGWTMGVNKSCYKVSAMPCEVGVVYRVVSIAVDDGTVIAPPMPCSARMTIRAMMF